MATNASAWLEADDPVVTSLNVGRAIAAADQYVSPYGNDSWDGTVPKFTSRNHGPVADICTARKNVRPLLGRKAVLIEIEDGSEQGSAKPYFATAACPYPIAFTSADSGTNAVNTVTYRAYLRDMPIFDGGLRLTGWKLSKSGLCAQISNCYSTTLSASTAQYFEGLFYNGVRRFRPRMGAGLSFQISSVAVIGSGPAALIVATTTSNHMLQPASTVTLSGVSGGSGLNITCSIIRVTANKFGCWAPNASGSGIGGIVTVDNKGQYYRIAMGCRGTCDNFRYTMGDPVSSSWTNITVPNPGSGNPTNDIVVYSFQAWPTSIGRISSIDSSARLITVTGNLGNSMGGIQSGFNPGHRYLIENVRDLFGQPGQWFLDRTTSPNWTVYYILQAGDSNPNADEVIVPQVPQGSTRSAQTMTPADLFTFTDVKYFNFGPGLTFRHDNTIVPQAGYNDSTLQPNMVEAVYCGDCSNFVLIGNTFTQTMGTGFNFQCPSGPCRGLTIHGNSFYDIGANGIHVGPFPNRRLAEDAVPTQITMQNNYLAYGGRVYSGASGIAQGLVNNSDISHTTVHDWYQKGIQNCSAYCGGGANRGLHDVSVHDNVIWNISLGMNPDTAGIYLCNNLVVGAGLNDVISHNLVHDVIDSGISGLDRDGYGGQPIYVDNASGAVTITNNVVYRGQDNLSMTLGPNTDAACGTLSNCQIVIKNNISADGFRSLVGVQNCPPGTGSTPPASHLQFVVSNNLFLSRMTAPSFHIQRPNGFYFGHGNPLAFQDWNNNQYFNPKTDWTTGTPFRYATNDIYTNGQWVCQGINDLSWASWSSAGIPGTTGAEDSGSLVANPNFTQPYCTQATVAACVADPKQDNYSAIGTPGMSPRPPAGSPIVLSGWGAHGFTIPAVIDTFPILPLNPSVAFCPQGNCP